MDDVMVYAEYEPHHDQLVALLGHLESLDGTPVTALLHLRHDRMVPLMDEIAGAHGLSAKVAVDEIDTERRWEQADARRHLSHIVGLLRAAGHPTHGELLTGPALKVLVQEVRARHPRLVLLVTSRHRLAHWARHDLEHRIRAVTDAEVVAVLPPPAPDRQ
jgi:hypothetical protein